MKIFTKIVLYASVISLPFVAFADSSSTSTVPVHSAPINTNIFAATSHVLFDWNDIMFGTTSASYHFELAKSTTTNGDGSMSSPFFVSSLLTASNKNLSTTTPDGLYYWHVRSVNPVTLATSTWSTPWSFILDTTTPTTPTKIVLISSIAPNASTTNGTQVWSLGTSTDATSGVLSYQYALNSTSTWITNTLTNSLTTTLGTGNHTLLVRALDKAGNISGVTSVVFSVTASSTTITSTKTDTPKKARQCKNDGWRTFTSPSFKNQGKCVSFIEKALRDIKKSEHAERKEMKKKLDEAKKESHNREKEVYTMTKHHGNIKDSVKESSSTKEKMMHSDTSEQKNKDTMHEDN